MLLRHKYTQNIGISYKNNKNDHFLKRSFFSVVFLILNFLDQCKNTFFVLDLMFWFRPRTNFLVLIKILFVLQSYTL